MKGREQSNTTTISFCFFLLTCFPFIPRKICQLFHLLDQNMLHTILLLPELCPSWTISSPSAQHNAGPAMSKTNRLLFFQTHRSQNLTQAVFSLQGTETWMSANEGQQVHKVFFKTNCCILSQPTTQSGWMTSEQNTAVFCSASHARNPARAFPPASQGQQMRGQYLRRVSYPI